MKINTAYYSTTAPASRFASEEFKRYYEILTKKTLRLVDSPDEADLIAVDDPSLLQLPEQIKNISKEIIYDGYVTGSLNNKVYLLANSPRGLLYATYDLLKRSGGIVFAAPEHEYLPESETFSVNHPITIVNPKLKYRGIGFHTGWADFYKSFGTTIDWMVKMGFNWVQFFPGSYEKCRKELCEEIIKRDIILDVGAHSAFFFLPPDKLFASNPELFSRTTNGEKIAKQLCYGNPATRDKLATACLNYLSERPEIKILGLWPEDGCSGDCECKWCHGQKKQKLVGDVVNYVARKIPHVMVNHLAYCQFVKAPSELKFADNVLVNHCDYWSRTINHPLCDLRYGQLALLNSEARKHIEARGNFLRDHFDIRQELLDWKKCTSTLTAFSYYSDLVMKQSLLTDVSETIEVDLNFYAAMGMRGFMDCCCHPAKSLAFAFNQYALANFSWLKDDCREYLLKDFCLGYFGTEAADSAVKIYNLVKELMDTPSLLGFNMIDLYHRDSSEVAWQCGMIYELIEPERQRVSSIFVKMEEALEVSGTEELRLYVDDLNKRFQIDFGLYIVWANIYQRDLKQAETALNEVKNSLVKYTEWNVICHADREKYINEFEVFIDHAQKHLLTNEENPFTQN